ncbi:MAG: hypothetical protein ABFS39_13675 [Pseudomonadota bacterium]
MKNYPRPMSDEFINASPEKWMGNCFQWMLVDKNNLDTEKQSSDRGHKHDEDHPE